jgi:hypothetical protein
MLMQIRNIAVYSVMTAIALLAGCRKNAVDKEAFKSALNGYYRGRQVCLWDGAIKLPAQADTNDDSETKRFDALTDAGLMTRMPTEKKRFLVGSKSVTNYDLSANGHTFWTADTAQPGYGNFCLGTRKVDSILAYSPPDSDAPQYIVNYHYSVDAPDWAKQPEIKTAFPQIGRDVAGENATATLVRTDSGWNVEKVAQ